MHIIEVILRFSFVVQRCCNDSAVQSAKAASQGGFRNFVGSGQRRCFRCCVKVVSCAAVATSRIMPSLMIYSNLFSVHENMATACTLRWRRSLPKLAYRKTLVKSSSGSPASFCAELEPIQRPPDPKLVAGPALTIPKTL